MNDDRVEVEETREVRIEGGCPLCAGALDVRFTPGRVWAWCGACRRLSSPRVSMAANGPAFLHPAAAA